MRKRLRKKLSGRRGFSLAETLIALVLMTLVSGVVIQTITVATAQLNRRTRDASAIALCDTISLAVRDELSYVSVDAVETDASDNVTRFKSGVDGLDNVWCAFYDDGGQIKLQYDGASGYFPLVSPAAYGDDQTASLTVTYSSDTFSVTVRVLEGTDELASRSFAVKPILSA